MTQRPRVLLLGGIDPSGGAGLSLDAAVVTLCGAHPLPVPLVLTAQNRFGFRDLFPVAPDRWRPALQAALDDGPVAAAKIGLIGCAATALELAEALRPLAGRVPVVVDPVLCSTAGGFAAGDDLIDAYREHLFPLAALVTPNLVEADALLGGDATAALRLGARAVLIKGGHGGGEEVEELLLRPGSERRERRPRLDAGEVRGTGCALASAIASHLVNGSDVEAACRAAGDLVHEWIRLLGPPPKNRAPRCLEPHPPLRRGG